MSQGVYGTSIPANVDPINDVEIWYNYRASRTEDSVNNSNYYKLDSSCLVSVKTDKIDYISGAAIGNTSIEGMYTLKLPLSEFSQKGFYSIYIKPKEIPVVIADIAPLSAYSDIKGIVIDSNQITDNTVKSLVSTNNSLVGYRIVYIENGERRDDVRIITSNNRCEPMVQTTGSKTTVYRYNDSASTVFITVTPSTAPSFKPNASPYIVSIGQQILLVNTKFEPIHLDIEMVENDADTIATLISGDQLRSLDEGLITTYNSSKEIFMQQEVYTLKDKTTGRPIYEVRKLRDNIDFSQELPS